MWYLLVVSIVWAFSFGLIGRYLADLDAGLVGALRLGMSLVVFLPWLRVRGLRGRDMAALAGIGAVQYGIMYVSYIQAFRYLSPPEVALFTIFTPLYVTWTHDFCTRRWHVWHAVSAAMAVAGTGVILYQSVEAQAAWRGFALMQLSNICFGAGQVAYRRMLRARPEWRDREVFGWLYLGAVIPAALVATVNAWGRPVTISLTQWAVLAYLGVVASGLCFFVWNYGARRVNVGLLAVFNNLKIPLAVLVSLVVFGQTQGWRRTVVGGAVIVAAAIVNEWATRRHIPRGTE